MSMTMGGQGFTFTCRRCGLVRAARFDLPYAVTKAYAAKCVKMRNTRWGAQCVPRCKP